MLKKYATSLLLLLALFMGSAQAQSSQDKEKEKKEMAKQKAAEKKAEGLAKAQAAKEVVFVNWGGDANEAISTYYGKPFEAKKVTFNVYHASAGVVSAIEALGGKVDMPKAEETKADA